MQVMLNDRFWTKVDKTHASGCWVWTANKNNKGYGLFRPGGSAPKCLAHRLSYEESHGPIPVGKIILHSCDNPSCVNPDHLRAGSYKENVADMDRHGRRVSNPRRGQDNPNSLVDEKTVLLIRRAYVSGISIGEMQKQFSMSRGSIHEYVGGRSWQHLLAQYPSIDELKAEARRRTMSNSRLTRTEVDCIRSRLSKGETGVSLAIEFGVTPATISDIKTGRTWP